MMTSGSNPNGVWTQVIAVIPRPEIEELAKIIGKRLIDTNESLWQELCALKEIVADFLTFEFGNMKLLKSPDGTPDSQTGRGSKSRPTRSSQSRRNHECDSDSDYAFNNATNTDFINHVKDSLSVSKIHEVLNIVQEEFSHERSELEAEIALLQTTMDTESEVISRGNTPRGDTIPDSFSYTPTTNEPLSLRSPPRGSHATLSLSNSPKVSRPDGAGGTRNKLGAAPLSSGVIGGAISDSPVHKSVVIMGPGRIRRSDSRNTTESSTHLTQSNSTPTVGSKVSRSSGKQDPTLTHSLQLKLTELVGNITPHEDGSRDDYMTAASTALPISRVQNGPSPSSSSSNSRSNSGNGSTRSRMRSRIETARDERFFMDEDVFLK